MGSELDKLIDAVEGGSAPFNMFADLWEKVFEPHEKVGYGTAFRAYEHGSLDAAKALHEALLPGWDMQRGEWIGSGVVCLMHPGGSDKGYVEVDCLSLGDMPMSWLLAILKAYRAQQQEAKNEM